MKTRFHLAAALSAVLAVGACNSEKKDTPPVNPEAANVKVDPPKSGDWSEVVIATPQGGFQIGNPNAKVKLIEYGSMTCPHCAEFEEKGVRPLIDNYVKNGQVAFEFRNFVRDPADMAASVIARCNGPQSFFALTGALFADQSNWFQKLQQMPADRQAALQNLPPNQQLVEMANAAGFQQWAAMRGLPSAKANACLANQAEVEKLVQMRSDADAQFSIPGTPAFVMNGQLVKDAASWQALEPEIKKALQ